MVSKEQALTCNDFHYVGRHPCSRHVGPRGGVQEHVTNVRRSGKTQVWKRNKYRFCVPVKYGLYESDAITEDNAQYFHVVSECPLHAEG